MRVCAASRGILRKTEKENEATGAVASKSLMEQEKLVEGVRFELTTFGL